MVRDMRPYVAALPGDVKAGGAPARDNRGGAVHVARGMMTRRAGGTDRQAEREAAGAVRAVYRDLAARPVTRGCTGLAECCQFKRTGLLPSLTRAEAIVAAKAFRATGRKELPEPVGGACPMLDPATSRCLIYADRPFGCRTHFCRAAGGP